jgi:long-subunit fatty acid transport protein
MPKSLSLLTPPRPHFWLLFLLSISIAPWAGAQIQINSTPSVVGSGARALGMGGAFIAIADDATAASWNPGGLTQLERPEASLVYGFNWRSERFNSSAYPGLGGDNDVQFSDINFASVVYPVPWTFRGRNVVLSLSYLKHYDFDRNLDINLRNFLGTQGPAGASRLLNLEYSQRGMLGSLSPAVGFELTERLSLGVVMNLYDQDLLPDNEWKTRQSGSIRTRLNGSANSNFLQMFSREEDYTNFEGTNYTLGAFFRATERLNLGLVYHTRFTADVDYERRDRTHLFGNLTRFRSQRDREITFPEAWGIGAAYRLPNDKLTLSLDVTRREWDKFVIIDEWELLSTLGASDFRLPRNRRLSGVTGGPKEFVDHDPTYTVRLGAEYVFVNEQKPKQNFLPSLRGGLFYDPEPSSGRENSPFGQLLLYDVQRRGKGDPDDFYGVAVGAGVLIKNRINIDAAYQYRWGTNVRKDTFGLRSTDADVQQHTFYLSTVVYF